jgi:predicted ATPase/class 3 adenylate cyclase
VTVTPFSARPTGTVAFLFSDIEGSTVRWERDRAVMATALSRHDELMRAALEARGAYIFKTVGDAFCAAFATTPDAIEAALEAQRAFAAEDFSAVEGLRVRMALHAGRSTERDGDYFGPAVNRVARLLAIGHGGQVLVSGTAADLLQGEMPSQCTLSDLGAHRLKDLAQPERVYQLVAPDLPETFPALRSLGYFANNLPAQLTSFVGREDVVSEIVALFEKHRLVTLVGTGGAGKTRCAIQVGAELLDRFGDGVWLAEFAPVSDSSLLASVVAQALSVQEHPNRPLLNTLTAYLKRKRLLLLFDNCEHVIEEAPTVATALLQACPDVRILATSREGLNVAGEQRYHMPSLSVPPADRALSALDALAFGAPLLFADRAISVDNRFAITDENVVYVAEICRRLDGIPLAIELAAARVKLLAPQRIAQMLDERFRVLTGGDRSALPRHQTMRALIDWSYDLLSEQERALFRKLSIFAGGFTLESAVATCSDAVMDEIAVFDALSSLVDKSLVHAEPTEHGTRYRLLESTRQYARERLDESGEYDVIARAHAAAFLAFAEELDRTWESELDRVWIARAQPELENFRVALVWAFGPKGDALLGQRLTGMLSQVWTSLGAAEGRGWVQTAQDLISSETPVPVIAALDLTEAALADALTQMKAAQAAGERAWHRYRELAEPLRSAYAQLIVGDALVRLAQIAEGEALLTDALAQVQALGSRKLTCIALSGLADARSDAGDSAGARHLYGESLAMAKIIGADRRAAMIAGNLAEAEFRGGEPVAALEKAAEARAAFRAFNDTGGIAIVTCNMAAYLIALGRYDEARAAAREALAAARDAQREVHVALALQHLAAVDTLRPGANERSLKERAASLLGYVDARLATLQALREYTEQQQYDAMLPLLRDALGADELLRLLGKGSAWSEEQAVEEATLI